MRENVLRIFTEETINSCKADNEKYFLWKIQQGWNNKNIPTTKEYIDRVNYEVSVICKMGFVDYMLMIADILEFADKNGIPRGPGRGSAAGSIISYATNITTIDPIVYGLYFERFLNPSRISNPDVDIDLGTTRRHEVFEYLQRKYGYERVASIMTKGQMKSRSIIRNVGGSLGMPTGPGSEIDKIAKLFPNMEADFDESVAENEELQKYAIKYPDLFDKAKRLAGKPKSVGVHAAGTLVAPCNIEELMPMGRGTGGKTSVVQWDMYDVEDAGLVKLDLLGLNTLDVIQRTLALIEKRYGKKIDIESIPMDDKLALNIFKNGKTNGLFQLERKYVQELCKKMNVSKFEEVCALNALIRPGTLHSGATDLYIKRKTGEEAYICPHKALENALADTYGVVLYQETAMQVARDYAGFTMAEADNLRKAIGKKIAEKMAEAKKEFFENAEKLGRPKEVTDMIFGQIETAQKYSFNKSHAVSYGKITYQSAWLKSHYFLEFMTELLNGEANSGEPKLDSYLRECRLNGVTILPPDARRANAFFQIENGKCIRFGLGFIKGVTESATKALKEGIPHMGTFTDLLMNDKGFLKKNIMENLILVGAFDFMGGNRARIVERYTLVKDMVEKYKTQQRRKKDGVNIRKEYSREDILNAEMNMEYFSKEYSLEECIALEHELCKCYIINDPLTPFEDIIESEEYRDIMDIEDKRFNPNKPIKLIAVLRSMNPHLITKGNSEGREMCFFEVFDTFKEITCIAFPDVYDKIKEHMFENAVYTFIGKYDGESIILNNAELMLKM
jgi:DNA polymerase-3 subunit alpha